MIIFLWINLRITVLLKSNHRLMGNPSLDEKYMRLALAEAREAVSEQEVPVGAVIVLGDEVIASAHNQREQTGDPTAHAEILALRKAAQKLGGWRLSGTRLYVTIEPCPMCAGALVLARVSTLVYGAADVKWGSAGSLFGIVNHPALNHRMEVISGVMAAACQGLMQQFFAQKRG
jgi:tRNA(adenine34) deaminase